MSLMQLLSTPCLLIRRLPSTDTDDFGNPIPATEEIDTTCEFQQFPSSSIQRREPGNEGELARDDRLLFLAPGTQASTGDRLEVAGLLYEFIGDPWDVFNPRTQQMHHVEAVVRRTATAWEAS